jgi:hypothetical protein
MALRWTAAAASSTEAITGSASARFAVVLSHTLPKVKRGPGRTRRRRRPSHRPLIAMRRPHCPSCRKDDETLRSGSPRSRRGSPCASLFPGPAFFTDSARGAFERWANRGEGSAGGSVMTRRPSRHRAPLIAGALTAPNDPAETLATDGALRDQTAECEYRVELDRIRSDARLTVIEVEERHAGYARL